MYNGRYRLTDLKTGKDIYPDMWTQVAAYKNLLVENGYPVDEVSIMNIPRADDEAFKHEMITPEKLQAHWEMFLHCREIYELRKKVKG
jgi:hypothetical protein